MFYVYEWYIVETGEIIYVGKGCRRRYKVTKHNKLFNEMIRRYKCNSRIIKEFENEEDAFKYEYDRVKELKEIGQCVCNVHDGGYGGSISWWTDDIRKKYSETNVMKSEYQRKRMKENNPMKNKETNEKVASTKRRRVFINGIEYESVKSACEKTGHSFDTIKSWCDRGINTSGERCYYVDKPINDNDITPFEEQGKPIIYNGEKYANAHILAKRIGISVSAVYAWANRGFSPKGIPCKREEDKNNYVFTNRHFERNKNRAKPIIVNGISYRSCEEASLQLKIPKTTIYAVLQGRLKSRKIKCEYDNQQPSQGNVNKSTLEGSTTNG